MALEDDWESKVDRRCARIMVEMDLRDGLYEEIVIKMHGSQWKQRLNDWKISFHCYGCREVGHLHKDYARGGREARFKKF